MKARLVLSVTEWSWTSSLHFNACTDRWFSYCHIYLPELAYVNKNVIVWEFLPVCGHQSIAYCWLSVIADVQETRITRMQVYWHTFWTHIWTGSIRPPPETQSSLHTCSTVRFQVTTHRHLFVSTVASVILACCHIWIRVHQGVALKTALQLNINGKCEVTSGINTDHYG